MTVACIKRKPRKTRVPDGRHSTQAFHPLRESYTSHSPAGVRQALPLTRRVGGCLLAVLLPYLSTLNLPTAGAGEVVAWGYNRYHQTNVPADLSNVVSVAGGWYHSLALRANGTVIAWGAGGPTNPTVDPHYGQATVPSGLGSIAAVAAGGFHSLALRSDGLVVAWGGNDYGQTTVPVGLRNVVTVGAGTEHSLALRSDGSVVAWGRNYDGETTVPPGLSNVVAVAAGGSHNLALRADGTVVAWGDNKYGQTTVPPGLSNVIAVAAGLEHSLALRIDGTVAAWGTVFNGSIYVPITVPVALSNVVAVAGGFGHNLALRSDGTLAAWGVYYNGSAWVPMTVPTGLSNAVAVAAGLDHSLVLHGAPDGLAAPELVGPRFLLGTVNRPFYHRILARNEVTMYGATGLPDGLVLDPITGVITGQPVAAGTSTVVLWATNGLGSGQRAVTLTINLPLPGVAVPQPVVIAGVGSAFSYPVLAPNATWFGASGLPPGLAIDSLSGTISGTPFELGVYFVNLVASNHYGTATGALTIRVSPVVAWGDERFGQTGVPGALNSVVAVATGWYHSLALRANGTVTAWADDYWGQRWGQSTVPAGLSNVVAVAAGGEHSLALRNDGTVVAWGHGESGQTNVPAGLTNAVAVAGGLFHSLALCADGSVVAWGYNYYGQSIVPAGLSNVVAVAAGDYHNLALRIDGTVVAWGRPDDGRTAVPPGLSNAVGVAAGFAHSLAVRANGTVAAWGRTLEGQATVPAGLSNVVAVAAGYWHSLGLRADGSMVAWGQYHNGSEWVPMTVPPGLSNVVAVAADYGHNLALLRSPGVVFGTQVAGRGANLTLAAPTAPGQPGCLQWYHNSTWIHAGNTLLLTNIQSGQFGDYLTVSQFSFGSVTNAVIHLLLGTGSQLSLETATGPVYRFKLLGPGGGHYTIHSTTNLTSPAPTWRRVLDLTLTNEWGYFDWTNAGEPCRVFRALWQ